VALAFLFSGKKVFVNEEYFSLKESKELNKVLLYTGNLPSGSFYKQADNSWQLNENIQVDKKMSALLMTVLKDVKIRKRVEKEEKEKVRQYLKKKGFVVEYYYHDLLNKAIYFASSEDKPGYTYAMTEEDEEPFVVYIPKAKLKIEELFSKPDYQWRDQTLFNSEYKNIEFVSVEYQNQKDSFEISKTGNEILLNGKIPSSVEQIQRYLGSFNSIEASAHLTNNEILLDSLRLSKPYCVIKVADKTFENKRSLNIYLCDQNSQIVYGQLDHQKEAYIIPIENIRSLMLKKGDLIKKAS
jgi:DNA-dependent RNA polymerase auxiliary subunit epsilon